MAKAQRDYSNQIPLGAPHPAPAAVAAAPQQETDAPCLFTKDAATAAASAREQGFLVTWEAPRIAMLLWGPDTSYSASNSILLALLEAGAVHHFPVSMAVYILNDRPGAGAVVMASQHSMISREAALALANNARKRGKNAERKG